MYCIVERYICEQWWNVNDTNFEFSDTLMFLDCSANSFVFLTAYSDWRSDNNFYGYFERWSECVPKLDITGLNAKLQFFGNLSVLYLSHLSVTIKLSGWRSCRICFRLFIFANFAVEFPNKFEFYLQYVKLDRHIYLQIIYKISTTDNV